MRVSPERAQEMFIRDIAPELHRAGAFSLYRQRPGSLAFSDGLVSAYEDGGLYSFLRRALSRRIKVSFQPDGAGTVVALNGGAGRNIRDALDRLGQPGHWPEGREVAD